MKLKYNILLDPVAEAQGGTAPAAVETVAAQAPAETPKAKEPLKPQAPRQPTSDELKTEFSSADMPELAGEQVVVTEKKEGAEKKEAIKPVMPPAQKPEAKVEPPAPTGVKPIMPPSAEKKTAQRDYTGFSNEEQAILKQMSNDAFDYTSRVLKEKKELEKLKGATFLQHPSAYTLDPQYQELQTEAHFVNKEFQYWQSQLEKITNGEEWQPILKWDAQGNPVVGTARKAGPMDAEQVRLAMNQCLQIGQQKQGLMQQFVGSYQQRIANDNAAIQAEQSKRFGWVADPKLMESKINVEGVGEKTIAQIRQDFINLFPAYHHNTPGVDVAANLFVALQIYGAQLREAQAGKQVAEIKKEEVLRAEPSSSAAPAKTPKTFGGVSTFTLEGMP